MRFQTPLIAVDMEFLVTWCVAGLVTKETRTEFGIVNAVGDLHSANLESIGLAVIDGSC